MFPRRVAVLKTVGSFLEKPTCHQVKDAGVMRVHWEDGTESDLQPNELRGGFSVFGILWAVFQ